MLLTFVGTQKSELKLDSTKYNLCVCILAFYLFIKRFYSRYSAASQMHCDKYLVEWEYQKPKQ